MFLSLGYGYLCPECSINENYAYLSPVNALSFAPAVLPNRQNLGRDVASLAVQLCLITDVPLLDSQHTLHMVVGQVLALLTGEQLCSLEHVFNFTAIHVIVCQLIQVFVTKIVLLATERRIEKIDPNMSARGCAEFIILHADMDPRLESGIDVVDSVSGEEENAFIVFQDAKEDGDEFVSLQIMRAALLKEDVGFVEEEDGVPFTGHLKYIGK